MLLLYSLLLISAKLYSCITNPWATICVAIIEVRDCIRFGFGLETLKYQCWNLTWGICCIMWKQPANITLIKCTVCLETFEWKTIESTHRRTFDLTNERFSAFLIALQLADSKSTGHLFLEFSASKFMLHLGNIVWKMIWSAYYMVFVCLFVF